MTEWTREITKTDDQRDVLLPPLWKMTSNILKQKVECYDSGIYQSGPKRQLVNKIIGAIDNAKKMVVVSSFLLADLYMEEALLNASKRGVRVYVLTASDEKLKDVPPDDPPEYREFEKKTYDYHVGLLNRLGGYVLFRSAAHFHAKAVLIDPQDQFNRSGFLLTANLTKEALKRNEEITVELESTETEELFQILRWALWEEVEHEFDVTKSDFKNANPQDKIAQPTDLHNIYYTTKHQSNLGDRVLSMIQTASNQIIVSNFGWDIKQPAVQALIDKARQGANVIVLTRIRPKTMDTLIELSKAGVRIFGYNWLHAKAIWTDSGEGIVMSANFEEHGLDTGFELGVPLHGNRAEALVKLLFSWIEQAPWQLRHDATLGQIESGRHIRIWTNGQLPKSEDSETVSELETITNEIVADSADELDRIQPEIPPTKTPIPVLTHEIRYEWTVVAPELGPNPNEIKMKTKRIKGKKQPKVSYDLPVYIDQNGRKVVAITNPNQLEQAKAIQKEVKAKAIVINKGNK